MTEKWHHVIFETIVKEHESLAGKIPENKDIEEFWISENQLIVVSNKGILQVSLVTNELTVTNPKLKLCAKFSLPLNLLHMVSQVAQLQLKYGAQYTGKISETEETKKINNKFCKKTLIIAEDTSRTKVEQWVTTEIPFDLEKYNKMMTTIRKFKFPLYDNCFHEDLNKKIGFPIQEEITLSMRGSRLSITKRMVDLSEKSPPKEIREIPQDYTIKDKISYSELTTQTLQVKKKYNSEEKKVVELLHNYQNWYLNRDINRLEEWLKETFTEDSYIIGTNAIFPGTHEWRKGIHVAKEVYTNDFHNNWNLRIFIDEADIEVDGDFAFVTVFGLVTRHTADHPTRNADTSRKNSLARIKSMTEKDWESKRALYEIIHDASMILVQYERGDTYLWPVRCTYNLKKINDKWKIKQLHYSWSGSGFPVARLYDEKEVK